MLSRNHPDRIQITFDDRRLVANAGLLLHGHPGPASRPARTRPGSASTWAMPRGGRTSSDKMMTLVASALAGGDCIDDADVLRTGSIGTVCSRLAGQGAIHPGDLPAQLPVGPRPSTRPGDPASCWPGPGRRRDAGPGDGPLTIDLDSPICETYGLAKEGARHHGYTGKRGLSPPVGRRRRHRRRADVPAARGPRQHRSGRRPLPA